MAEQWQIVIRFSKVLLEDIKRGELFQHAYAMAYVSLLSLVPSLAVTFAVISLFTPFLGENSFLIIKARELILSHLAAGSGEQVVDYLESFIGNVDLRRIGFTGFVGTLVVLILLLRNIETAFNKIFEVDQGRSLFMRFIYFWTIITLGTFLTALTIGTFSGFELSVNPYGLLSLGEHTIAGRVVYYAGILVFFTFIFKIVPNRFVGLRSAGIGAVVATTLLSLAISLFGIYTNVFRTYEAIYGAALSAIPFFLLWMYIVWLIILGSATLTWRLQRGFRQTENLFSSGFEKGCKHQEFRIRSDLPQLLISHIFKAYQKGKFAGLSPQDVAKNSSLPLIWIEEAVDSLAAIGLVHRVEDAATGEMRVFPSFLPGKGKTEECISKLWSQYDQRLQSVLSELDLDQNTKVELEECERQLSQSL